MIKINTIFFIFLVIPVSNSSDLILDAFILAAGRGERLRPLTDQTPKPLLSVDQHSLIEHHLFRLKRGGFTRCIINVSWLGQKIIAALGDGANYGLKIIYSEENHCALETAGGIRHALNMISSDEFIVISGDIWTDYPFNRLTLPHNTDMHLVMTRNPDHHPNGDFVLQESQLQAAQAGSKTLTYTGIGCFHRRIFETLEPGVQPLRPLIDQAISTQRASGTLYNGVWMDIGTKQRLDQIRHLQTIKNHEQSHDT